MGRVISTAIQFIDGFTKPSKEVIQSMQHMGKEAIEAGRQIQSAGKTISSVGSTLTTAITVPIAGVATAAVKTAADFESAMSQVAATMGVTKGDIGELSELAQQMGRTTAFSASEAADGINVLAMAGLNSKQIGEALGSVLDLASAGAMDMASSASYVTGAVKGFGDEMSNASKYADLMAKGATLASTDVESLGEAISYGAATAANYSQSAESVTLSLLRMAEQNVTGQTAATSLNRAMTDLYAPTTEAKKALDSLGVSAYNTDGSARDFNTVVDELSEALKGMSEQQANTLKNTIFTTNGMNAFNQMTASSSERVKELSKGLQEAGGSAAQQAETQLDNLNGQITLLKSAIEGAEITIGNKLLPYIKQAVSWINTAVEYINNLSDAQINNIMKWAGIAAAIGPAVMVFGKIVTAVGTAQRMFGTITKTIAKFGGIIGVITSPAGIVIGVLAAIAVAAVLIIKNWDQVKGFLQSVGNWFKNAFEKAGFSTEDFKNKFTSIGNTIGSIAGIFKKKFAGGISEGAAAAGRALKAIVGGVDLNKFSANISNIKTRVSSIINNLKTIFSVAFSVISSVIQKAMKIIVPVVKVAFSAMGGAISAKVNEIKAIISGLMTVLDGITTFISGVFTGNWSKAWEGVKTIFKGVFESLAALCKAPINAVIGIINGAIAGINKLNISIPDWVPGIGGQTFGINIPTIPMLYKGADNWKGGKAVINDRGGEIVDLPKGSRVYPHDKSVEMAKQEGTAKSGSVSINIQKLADKIEVRSDEDIDRIAEALAYKLKNVAFNTGTA